MSHLVSLGPAETAQFCEKRAISLERKIGVRKPPSSSAAVGKVKRTPTQHLVALFHGPLKQHSDTTGL